MLRCAANRRRRAEGSSMRKVGASSWIARPRSTSMAPNRWRNSSCRVDVRRCYRWLPKLVRCPATVRLVRKSTADRVAVESGQSGVLVGTVSGQGALSAEKGTDLSSVTALQLISRSMPLRKQCRSAEPDLNCVPWVCRHAMYCPIASRIFMTGPPGRSLRLREGRQDLPWHTRKRRKGSGGQDNLRLSVTAYMEPFHVRLNGATPCSP